MTEAVSLAFMAAVLLLAPIVSGATVGVVAGDWAKYGDIEFSSTIPSGMPLELGDFADFDWMKVTVQSVSGTSVIVQMLAHYKNGTEDSQELNGDVGSGLGNLTFLIVPTSLAVGDDLPLSFGTLPSGMNVSDVVTRSYAGAAREVYHMGYHLSESSVSGNVTSNFDMYWDKAKGVLCEVNISMTMSVMTYSSSATMKAKLVETNMWSGGLVPGLPDYTLYIIIGVVLVAVAIVVSVAMMRRRKTPTPKTGPSEQPTPTVESPKS